MHTYYNTLSFTQSRTLAHSKHSFRTLSMRCVQRVIAISTNLLCFARYQMIAAFRAHSPP